MYSLAKFAARSGRIGLPLPSPYQIFHEKQISFRNGATSMIAGKPGSFKSVLALNMLSRWADAGLTAVYFSADSDEYTVARRLSGILTRTDQRRVEADFEAKELDRYLPALRKLDNVRFEYRALSLDDIAGRLSAYETVYGDYPDVVFLDNLINFAQSSQDWAGMLDLMVELDKMSRTIKTHICVLHHASENWGDPAMPVPSAAIQGKVTQLARVVLTVAANELALAVACVKNTNGPSNPAADPMKCMRFQVAPSLRTEEDLSLEFG